MGGSTSMDGPGRRAPGRLTRDAAVTIATQMRAASPLVQVRQAGRIAQEMADPDIGQIVRAMARLAALDVDVPLGSTAVAAVQVRPDWWAAVLVAETVNHDQPDVGTLLALLDQPQSVVASVMVRLLRPAGLVGWVTL